ncbi:NAD-specific glutamate dehydrogenase [Holospora obtusa F1]|uniref:NAD-specific glutamate dehydrogenase n=1 Tax=Holospora obtusa F1 TaxID=1399147 RepID=W6TDL9_HOLOB|nr:NAD-glutamate dehydrogenase domain-containing protein [Holospora obtusa]ETZ06699.1 NAD-specific glutamate dehydrogenase [Holospora obtusa F1]
MPLYDTLSFPISLQARSWVFSCYHTYMKQIFSSDPMKDEFCKHSKELEQLLDYFLYRFSLCSDSSTFSLNLSTENFYYLNVLKALIDATVRTNLYVSDAKVFTIDIHHDLHNIPEVQRIPGMRELYVFHPHIEGVHLRASAVSRGGIRLSDREDYRKEAFDLLKTQRLKNAVVVPDGAKGVFYVKDSLLPEDGYRLFIQGLLSVMDNRDCQHAPVSAPKVRAWDESDSYLVVAPDKGTASYSGIANEIALKAEFWLKDAFASGGKTGYDHKKLGITSKGVWVSVETHMKHLGKNLDHPISLIGVGDMSGDVFGNGLLYSKNIKLLAAFDHRHIFLDPNPNLDQSYQERCRLFHLPSSSWMDYNKNILSFGGQIVSRSAPCVELSDEIQKMLNLECAVIKPEELIPFIFKMKCDVLWMAGIGTYIVGSHETFSGDEKNAHLRVSGTEIGATIIAEGANLGCTQMGRVDFEKSGGIVNIDAIDNCAGVLCSDHEVNFKILFQNIPIPEEARNHMLQAMSSEMVSKVLNQTYWQNISLYRAKTKFHNLTRPELAVKFLETKKNLKAQLSKINFQESFWDSYLLEYFPELVQKEFSSYILKHVLRQDILCTIFSNQLVDVLPEVWMKNERNPFHGLSLYHAFELFRIRKAVENSKDDIEKIEYYFDLTQKVFDQLYDQCPKGNVETYKSFRIELEKTSSGPLYDLWKIFSTEFRVIFKNNLSETSF